MTRLIIGFVLVCLFSAHAHAQSEVYLCVDEHGKKEYKNTGITKGCKKVDLPDITVIPAPPSAKKSANKASSPADFPKVDESTQKARDSDRRQILQDELRTEEQKLAELKTTYNDGNPGRIGGEKNYVKYQERVALLKDEVERSARNVEALKREISNLK